MNLSEHVLEGHVVTYHDQIDPIIKYLTKHGSLFKDSKEMISKVQKMKSQKTLSKNDKELIASLTKNTSENLSESIITLNEADKFKKIAQMTQDNNHNGAYVASAKMINDKKLEQAFIGIDAAASLMGGLDGNASAFRYSLYSLLKKRMEKKLSPEDYQAWYQST